MAVSEGCALYRQISGTKCKIKCIYMEKKRKKHIQFGLHFWDK